jgi:hypothetical protein
LNELDATLVCDAHLSPLDHKVQHGLGNNQHGLGNIQHGVGNIQHGSGNIQQGSGNIQHDLGNIQHGAGNFQHDVGNIQHGLGNIQHDLGNSPLVGGDERHKGTPTRQMPDDIPPQTHQDPHPDINVSHRPEECLTMIKRRGV